MWWGKKIPWKVIINKYLIGLNNVFTFNLQQNHSSYVVLKKECNLKLNANLILKETKMHFFPLEAFLDLANFFPDLSLLKSSQEVTK